MANYKADTSLNERDSLLDVLFIEKQLVKLYAFSLTEGVSKGFRELIKSIFESTVENQFNLFLNITETGHAKVTSAEIEDKKMAKEQFSKIKKTLK